MGIKPADANRLWAQSGGRCALCRLNLSAAEKGATLGEIAHIVARKQEGPRGDYPLALSERDGYENLILVCPNDHTKIDKTHVDEWSVDRLRVEKLKHERWVQDLLDRGTAVPVVADSSSFRASRTAYWEAEAGSWMTVSLTPLQIVDDAINPLTEALREGLISTPMPEYLQSFGSTPNSRYIAPNVHGIVVEDFSRIDNGMGYRIEIFRTGYLEFAICISAMMGNELSPEKLKALYWAPTGLEAENQKVQCEKLLDYWTWAETLIGQLRAICELWRPMPFNDMVLTTSLFGVKGACVLVRHNGGQIRVGRAAEEQTLTHAEVVSRQSTFRDLAEVTIQRFMNYLGLHVATVFDEQGELQPPTRLGSTILR